MRCPTLIAFSVAAALLVGTGCNLVSSETGANAPVKVTPGKPYYAAFERQRVEALHDDLAALLAQTIRHANEVLELLEAGLAELSVPERFSTNDRALRTWHEPEWYAHRAAVEQVYETALLRLQLLHEQAIVEAVSRAEKLAGNRSPLDDGPTGNTLVDQAVTAFIETLRAELAVQEIESRAEHDAVGQLELVHVFSTFTSPGADEVLGGRLILFIGGSKDSVAPHARLVLQGADAETPKGIRVLQAARYRVYRGHAIVRDMGWHPMPRGPELSFHKAALIIGNIAPRLDTSAPAFDELYGMRVVADLQTVLVGGDTVLGGLDWRIEFRITVRGDVSWQLSEAPQFNPICEEAIEAFR